MLHTTGSLQVRL